jgi:hypothetical protein
LETVSGWSKTEQTVFFRWQQKSFKRIQCASSARCIDVKRTYLGTCFNYVSIPVNPMDGSHDFYVHNFILWLHRYTVSIWYLKKEFVVHIFYSKQYQFIKADFIADTFSSIVSHINIFSFYFVPKNIWNVTFQYDFSWTRGYKNTYISTPLRLKTDWQRLVRGELVEEEQEMQSEPRSKFCDIWLRCSRLESF